MNTLPLSTRDFDLPGNSAELISDDDIDYAAMAAQDMSDSVIFNPDDYASDDEMMKAVEQWVFQGSMDAQNEAARQA